MKFNIKIIAILSAVALIAACSSTPTGKSDAMPKTPQELCSITVNDINTGSTKRVLANIDMPKFVDAALKGHNILSDTEKEEVAQALSKELLVVLNGFTQFSNSWHIVQTKKSDNRLHCILRGDGSDGGVSYIDFQIINQEGHLSIVDWYNHSSAVLASEAFGRGMVDLAKIYKKGGTKTKEDELFHQYISALKNADYPKVMSLYPKLPKKYQDTYVYALRHLEVVGELHPEQLQKHMDALITRFGEQRYYGLLLVDHYYELKVFKKVNHQLDKVIERVGEDDWLFILKAVSAQELEDDKLFYQSILKAVNARANYDVAYWMLLKYLAKKAKYRDALLVLDVLKLGFSYQFTEASLSDQEEFGDMAKSEAYQEWLNLQHQ